MFTIIIAVIFLAILIIGHEFGHFITAKLFGLRVEEFGFGFPPRIFKKQWGETTYTLNAIPFGGFVKIYGETATDSVATDKSKSFQYLSVWKKIVVIVAGAFMNFIIGVVAISILFRSGVAPSLFIGGASVNSPAQIAGLAAGDKIVDFKNAKDFSSFIEAHKGEEINLNILRAGENLNIKLTPRVNPPAGEGPIGVSLIDGGIPKENVFSATYDGFKASINILGLIFGTLFSLVASLFIGNWQVASSVTGPVGIFNFLDTAGGLGLVYLLQILGLISLNLAAMNVIPFPALDGGRLAFIVYEKVSGGRLNPHFENAAHTIGFVLLILLMLAVTVKDIMNLV